MEEKNAVNGCTRVNPEKQCTLAAAAQGHCLSIARPLARYSKQSMAPHCVEAGKIAQRKREREQKTKKSGETSREKEDSLKQASKQCGKSPEKKKTLVALHF